MKSDIRTAIRQIQSGKIKPVYLLHGDDQFLQQLIVSKIEEQLFKSERVNKTVLLPDEMGSREIMDRLTSSDLFTTTRLFVLYNAHMLKGNAQQEFFDYLDNPTMSHFLVIVADEDLSRRKTIQKIMKNVPIISIRTPFESEIKKWVNYFYRENGIKPGSSVINATMDVAGDSLYHLSNEINKICLSLEEDQELTEEMVLQFAGWRKAFQPWDLLDAIGNRDLHKALRVGCSLLDQKESLVRMISTITTFFQELLFLKMATGTFTDNNSYIPLFPSIKKRLPVFGKKYSKVEIIQALSILGDIDQRLKTSVVSDDSEYTKFIFTVLPRHD